MTTDRVDTSERQTGPPDSADGYVAAIDAKYGALWAQMRCRARRAVLDILIEVNVKLPKCEIKRELMVNQLTDLVYNRMLRSTEEVG